MDNTVGYELVDENGKDLSEVVVIEDRKRESVKNHLDEVNQKDLLEGKPANDMEAMIFRKIKESIRRFDEVLKNIEDSYEVIKMIEDSIKSLDHLMTW